jgi:hypothetical protein
VQAAAPLFHFRNGFWINLHHYLYAQALATSDNSMPRLRQSAINAQSNVPCPPIPEGERGVWQQAVDFYAVHYLTRDWLFDNDMRELNDLLSDADNNSDPPAGLPTDLRQVLTQAAAAYRTGCWATHQRANSAWIEALEGKLAQHGTGISQRLEEIYQAKWPVSLVVDVVTYANWAGAYTYDHHITADSVNPDYRGDSALEMIFHESSHALDGRLFDQVHEEFARNHADMPRQFDHALIFFTAGVITKQELHNPDPDYVPVADRLGIYKRIRHGSEDEKAFRQYWQPYLEGKTSREKALRGLVQAICCGQGEKSK